MSKKFITLCTLLAGLSLTGAGLTGCSSQGSQENKAKAEMMSYANGSGKSLLAKNSFNKDKNTDDITFTPSAVKNLNTTFSLNQQLGSKNNKVKHRAQAKAKQMSLSLKETNMKVSGLRSALKKASVDSKDKNMKVAIINPSSTFPSKDIEQIQLQPNSKIRNQQQKKLVNNMKKQQAIAQQKQKQNIMNRAKNTENKQRKSLQAKMNRKHVPMSQQHAILNKLNQRYAQQNRRLNQKLNQQLQKINRQHR